MERESFKSRLGFILISAGCAIGIGNVWRFPYVAGQNGGGIFVLFYLLFLIILGIPVMVMEFSVGRASRKSAVQSFRVLEKPKGKWHIHGYVAMAGNYMLMFFYTMVAGWMFYYFYKMLSGGFENMADSVQVSSVFDNLTQSPFTMGICSIIAILLGFGVCAIGLQKGVEKVTKLMMLLLLGIMVILAINSIFLDGGSDGLKFYLLPSISRVREIGLFTVIVEAMNQAFFTLSIGIGSMAIFGSYLDKDNSLLGESLTITALDTFVAIVAGLIIFPACFAYGVDVGSGPKLIFVTLPNIFLEMPLGRLWGSLFFLFMSFAAFSTVIAVFENIMSFGMDLWNWSRKKTALINIVVVILGSLPCIFGFNIWSSFAPLGKSIMDWEDFFVSNLCLPLGSLIYLLFCVSRHGWGWDNFIKEANTGKGLKLSPKLRIYLTYVLPLIILLIFGYGIYNAFFA